MNNETIEYLVNRILSGVLIFYYNEEEYVLKNPTPIIKYRGHLLYHRILQDEKYSSWIREWEATNAMIKLGVWDSSSDATMAKLEKAIEDNKLKLYESLKRPDVFKATRKTLNDNNKRLSFLSEAKNSFRNKTLEGYAESIKSEYIICNTLYKNGKKMFGKNQLVTNYNRFSYNTFNSIIQEIYKNSISIEQIRELARSPLWRTYWIAGKENTIGNAISNWTDDQRSLVNFSRMYDNVYEHPEAPDDKVIEDDDVLDGWFIYQKRKREKEKKQSKNNNRNNSKADNAQEVFLFPNEDQTAEEIMDLNDTSSKMRYKQKMNFLNKAQTMVEEHQLPDVKTDLLNQRAEMKRMNKK